MPKMKYQLVLQLQTSSMHDYDEMIELEEAIMKSLGHLGKVDGHDVGQGAMNIFIFTDWPKPAFDRIKELPSVQKFLPDLKAAFCEDGKNEFAILHPADLIHFAIV